MKNTKVIALIITGLVLSATGCLSDDAYLECKLSPSMVTACGAGETDNGGVNCVITEHPQCVDGICISYQGNDAFCSLACLTSDDCPEGGVCIEFAKGCDQNGENCAHYCVKDSLAE
jgi:hypothetical protein